MKKYLPYVLLSVLAFYLGNRISCAVRLAGGILEWLEEPGRMFASPLPSLNGTDLLMGMLAALFALGMYALKRMEAKKYRKGVEYGSARWSA